MSECCGGLRARKERTSADKHLQGSANFQQICRADFEHIFVRFLQMFVFAGFCGDLLERNLQKFAGHDPAKKILPGIAAPAGILPLAKIMLAQGQEGLSRVIVAHRKDLAMTFPLQDPLPGQFDWILQDIRNGLNLPDHFADQDDEQAEEESTYTRWWENPADPDYQQYQSQKGR